MNPNDLIPVAIEAGRTAARICRRVQKEQVLEGVPDSKANNEPVTVADYASQAVILREVARAFPDHDILAEENSQHLREQKEEGVGQRVRELVADATAQDISFEDLCAWIDHSGGDDSPYRWAIDPIDGTKGFLRRAQYAVAIGVLENGVPLAGVLVCPNLEVTDGDDSARGVIFSAVRGAGTYMEPLDGGDRTEIHANPTTDAGDLRVMGSVESSHGDPKLLTSLVKEMGMAGDVVRVDSQVKYGVLARGGAEVYLRPRSRPDYRENAWDHVAGVIVATEAGARATDVDGKALDFTLGNKLVNNRGVLVTNGPLHENVVQAIAAIEARS